MDRIAAEELTVPPGGDELFSLLVLKHHVESGDYDTIIVDCAPTGETLRLLSFPDAARWWLDKVLGKEQSMLSAARPLARMFLDVQLPDEKVLAEVQRLVGNLVAMHELLRDGSRVSMRLVMTPDRMVVGEAMRTYTYLNLYGYLTDAVVVNRVFPDELSEGYFGAWHAVQQEQLALVASAFAVPVLKAPYFASEVIGPERLDELGGAIFAEHDPAGVLHDRLTQELTVTDDRRARCGWTCRSRERGADLAEEDRARAGRPRGRPQAHDRPPGRAGRLQADLGHARGGLARGGVPGWLSARTSRPPRSSCARRRRARSRPPTTRRATCRPTAGRSPAARRRPTPSPTWGR